MAVARASNPTLGIEAEGKIGCDRWNFRFEAPEFAVEIPLARLQITLSEEPAADIEFSDPDQPEWTIRTADARILKDRYLLSQAQTSAQIRSFRTQGEMRRRLKVTLYFVAGFAVAAIIASALIGLMVRALVARIPASWEKQVGDSLMGEIKQEAVFVEDSKLKAKVQQAVAPLLAVLPANGTRYTFYIVDEPLPNAFALPGGHVLINSGLLSMVERPEELAGVVAHEIAHVTEKHGFRKIISAAGPFLVMRIFMGGSSGLVGFLGDSSQLLVRQSFSQEYELEADAVGWKYLNKAHIDPRGFIHMLGKLEAETSRFPSFEIQAFSSHPATQKRIRRLEAKWETLKDKTGFIRFPEVKEKDQ